MPSDVARREKEKVMEQRVEFVNDELIVFSNGTRTDSKGSEVKFEGDFVVDARVVAKLAAMFHKKNMAVCYPSLSIDRNWRSYYVADEEMARVIKGFESDIEKLKDDKAFVKCELQVLKEKIAEFNRTRKWYERKFKF